MKQNRDEFEIFEYYVYGHKLLSNVQLPMLTPYINQCTICDVTLVVKADNKCKNDGDWQITTSFQGDNCVLKIGNKVVYHIDCAKNSIEVKTCDLAWMKSTILNLPFALYFAIKDMILLHASALIDNNGDVIPLCAPKGTGKTTLSLGLSRFFDFYSDDTVMVRLHEGELQCFCGSSWIKLNEDSFKLLGVKQEFDSLQKNVQGKAYYNLGDDLQFEHGKIKKLFFLRRIGNEVKMAKITQPFTRKIFLHANICGSTILGYEYCKKIEKSKVFSYILTNTEFIKITIQDDIELFENTVEKVKYMIDDTDS